MQGGVGIRGQYRVENDDKARKEVIAKFTQIVDDPKFNEKYYIIRDVFDYKVMSNLSKREVFTLTRHVKNYVEMSRTYHSITVPGVTSEETNREPGFLFFEGEAAHICSKLMEYEKIQTQKERQIKVEQAELQKAEIRNHALQRLRDIG